jgi:hypothetical protein
MCVNDTTRLPNGQKCPAFALVVRNQEKTGGMTYFIMNFCLDNQCLYLGREAMLVIRGSQSTMDWAINFDEEVTEFQYWYPNDTGSYISTTGQVHRGIHQVLSAIIRCISIQLHT